MSFGNPDKGLCPKCKHVLESVEWCENDRCECSYDCPSCVPKEPCAMRVDKVRCPKCEVIYDPE